MVGERAAAEVVVGVAVEVVVEVVVGEVVGVVEAVGKLQVVVVRLPQEEGPGRVGVGWVWARVQGVMPVGGGGDGAVGGGGELQGAAQACNRGHRYSQGLASCLVDNSYADMCCVSQSTM